MNKLQKAIDRIRGKKFSNRAQRLLKSGFALKNGIWTTPSNIQVKSDYSELKPDVSEIDFILNEIFLQNCYEINLPNNCIVFDVGMNRGIASLFFAQKSNVLHVYGFEPFLPTFKQAEENFELNPALKPKITPSPFGLGDNSSIAEITYSGQIAGQMSTLPDNENNRKVTKGEERTQTVTIKQASEILSPLIEKNADLKIIAKIDTEGSEFAIIKDLNQAKLLPKIDVFILEYHADPSDLEKQLCDNGFFSI